MKERSAAEGRIPRVIREGRSRAGWNQQQLADRLGVSRAAVAGWETGHSRPDLEMVPGLCRELGLSLSSFFGVREGLSKEERSLILTLRGMEEDDRQAILWQAEALSERRSAQRREQLRGKVVRLYRSDLSAAAGVGAPLEAERGEMVWLYASPLAERADEIISVNGRSMEPTFADGDQLLVEHASSLREGEIGVFLVDGEGFVKEYRADGLHSHNPAYPVMGFAEGNEVRCLGRVLGKIEKEQWPTEKELAMLEGMEK